MKICDSEGLSGQVFCPLILYSVYRGPLYWGFTVLMWNIKVIKWYQNSNELKSSHRSVRGSHILIDNSGRVVLSGLRHSTIIHDSTHWKKMVHCYPLEARYNLNWASPELLAQVRCHPHPFILLIYFFTHHPHSLFTSLIISRVTCR